MENSQERFSKLNFTSYSSYYIKQLVILKKNLLELNFFF